MSSPPVANGRAAVGRTVSAWNARVRASVERAQPAQREEGDQDREDEELDPRVGEARLDRAPAREAEDDHPGEVRVVELVDRDVALVDQDVAVAVDHLVRRPCRGRPGLRPARPPPPRAGRAAAAFPSDRQTTSSESGTRVAPKRTIRNATILAVRERRRIRPIGPSPAPGPRRPTTATRPTRRWPWRPA